MTASEVDRIAAARRGPRPTPRAGARRAHGPDVGRRPVPVPNPTDRLGARCEPIVHLATGSTVAHEVLASRLAVAGRERPQLASELAELERIGTIGPVTDVMLERAWHLARGLEGRVHVNVSAVDLADPRLPERIAARWPARDRCRLVLEVTEHRRVVPSSQLEANLAWAREQAIAIAVDDYGDGHADDRTVALLLPDLIKVSAVGLGVGGGWDDRTCRVLSAIATHLDGFGATTVVEGIDHPDQVADAARCGFDLAQGHHFSRRRADRTR